jgi:predicted Rossmann-fold nucleotide-binding protein
MPRFDKYNPVSGGFRGLLAANYTGSAAVIGVGIDANGHVVVGGGQTGIVGVIQSPLDKKAGAVIDVMTGGEIVEAGLVAGTIYTANTTTGVVSSAAASATQKVVGFTVEARRLIIRMLPNGYIGT